MTRTFVVVVMVGCVIDAVLTLYGMKAGFLEELNPFMRGLIGLGEIWFIGVKMLMTGIAVWFLVKMIGKGHECCQYILGGAAIIYLMLTCWHILLIIKVHS